MRALRSPEWPPRDLRFYLGCVALVSLGVFVHVVLFNLYLVDAGLREDAMGRQQMLMTAGTALAIVPASWAARRFGLRRTIAFSIAGIALALAARSHAAGAYLGVSSFGAGAFLAGWFVSNAPAVAALARRAASGDEAGTTAAFGFNIALAIAVGAIGGLLGARLPGWIPAATPLAAKRAALLVAALVAGAGLAPLLCVRFPYIESTRGTWRADGQFKSTRRFLARYLLAVAPWYLFGAGFLPFLNVFLRNRFNASLGDVGNVFAIAQVGQAGAVLLAVPVSALLGNIRAVVTLQLLAAAGLFAMWPAHTLTAAAAVYVVYIAFQVMSEPGLQSLLMSRVPASARSAASGVNLLVMFGMQALAGELAGKVIVARGYATWFVMLALVGVASAVLFAALFARASRVENVPAASAARNFQSRP